MRPILVRIDYLCPNNRIPGLLCHSEQTVEILMGWWILCHPKMSMLFDHVLMAFVNTLNEIQFVFYLYLSGNAA